MAHFARVVDGLVVSVEVLANDVIEDDKGVERETLGQKFLSNLYGHKLLEFVQCSYNESFRKNYPGIGFTYDADRDAFIPPHPYPSWVLDEATCLWEAPVAYPDDGKMYAWDESGTDWVEVQDEAP